MTFKALILDIETAPGIAYIFNSHKPYISPEHIIKDTSIICFAASWADQREVMFHADWIDGHRRMIEAAYRLINNADALVHYNGESFDLPHFQFEWAKANKTPARAVPHVDMMKTVNRKFRGLSHRLAFIGPELKVGEKIKNEGFQLWRDVVEGDRAARRRMERYCRGDVILEKALYKKLLPWFGAQHPNVSLFMPECGEKHLCTACGSSRLQNRGLRRTATFTYRAFRCRDCGARPKERMSLKAAAKPLTVGI